MDDKIEPWFKHTQISHAYRAIVTNVGHKWVVNYNLMNVADYIFSLTIFYNNVNTDGAIVSCTYLYMDLYHT